MDASDLDINDPLVKSAVLGSQVEQFLETDIGKYLVGRAENQAAEAMDMLKRTAPWRKNRIQQLQNAVLTAENFQKWLGEAYSEGLHSLHTIEGDTENV
jgi:copper homeostasis protein CutC